MSDPHPASRIPRYDQLGPDPEPLGVRAELLLGEAFKPTPAVSPARPRAALARRRSRSTACHAR